jgi:hypothetical protein
MAPSGYAPAWHPDGHYTSARPEDVFRSSRYSDRPPSYCFGGGGAIPYISHPVAKKAKHDVSDQLAAQQKICKQVIEDFSVIFCRVNIFRVLSYQMS